MRTWTHPGLTSRILGAVMIGLSILLICPYAEAQTCVQPPSGMTSWYPFDTDATDISGSNNGNLVDGAVIVPGGEVDGACSLDGVDDWVSLPQGAFSTLAGGAIDAWIFGSTFADPFNEKTILSARGTVDGVQNVLEFGVLSDGTLRMVVRPNTGELLDVRAPSIPAGSWHHVAFTTDALSGNKLYIDGMQVAAAYVFGSSSTRAFFSDISGTQSNYIGTCACSPNAQGVELLRHWDGLIDEVEVHNRVLSAAEIQSIYLAGAAGKCKCGASSGRVSNLQFRVNDSDLTWDAASGAASYDVVKGDLIGLRSTGGDFTSSLIGCLENDSPDPVAVDLLSPAPGGGFYYLVRYTDTCGQRSSYDSGSPSQQGSCDAEINASLNSCS